jgi:predicted Zn-dependent protease
MKKAFVLWLIVSLTFLACSKKEESASRLFDKALASAKIGKYDDADKIFQNIIRDYPETQIAANLKELAITEQDHRAKAVSFTEKKVSEPTPSPFYTRWWTQVFGRLDHGDKL